MQKIKQYFPYILLILASTNILTFMPHLGNFLYVLYGIAFVFGLFQGQNRFSGISIIFFAICILSILFNDIPAFFRPWLRLVLFAGVAFLVGPFVSNVFFDHVRVKLFFMLRWIYVFLAVISAVGKMLGFQVIQNGLMAGFTGHSLLLGFFSYHALLFLLYYVANDVNILKKKMQKRIIMICAFLCLLMLFGAASRCAFLAFVCGTFIFYFLAYRDKRQLIVKYFIYVCICLCITYPIWSSYFEVMKAKNKGKVTSIDIDSRQGLWENGWNTYMRHPILGVGFSSVVDDKYLGAASEEKGQIELGNSYLTVMVMTGSAGALFFFILLGKSLAILKRVFIGDLLRFSYVVAVLASYMLHLMAEGYVMSGGSACFFDFWLTLGAIDAYSRISPSDVRIFGSKTIIKSMA